ncbi:MAG TPA: Mov34/MPN/PAD-1 family protein [Actinocrinis sp.]|uniref:Mov34/MPN/PAD-1 family protein n=1 Tax=Actinocrinis sp. TaxID=1920516 RepID=UPI002DDD3D8D|nr:Mov34/MPN/PAD-1 family protein [Actinocrinis sp.]HEV2345814.1 Mov34/MPN/PAD-1 family protein [Actinocrinis sp.]
MTVHRAAPLPTGPAAGRLIVAHQVVGPTLAALRATYEGLRNEALVLWAGRTIDGTSVVTSIILPRTDHGPGHVLADEAAVNDAVRLARRAQLGVIAQVHSHPGSDTRHSDGDDRLVLMPFDGMFSLVVARYGQGGLTRGEGAGLHQFQHGRWVYITDDALVVAPPVLALPEEAS